MPGTVRIWWHDGAVKDVRNHDIPVVAEPELGFETVTISGVPTASGPAPEGVSVAIIETDVDLRYTVRPPGVLTDASIDLSKPIPTAPMLTESIGVQPGFTISFIEA